MDDRHLSSFEAWLDTVRGLNARTIGSLISNCKRVERYEGDLDPQFDNDGLGSLLERLTYSTEDATNRKRPKHTVPIHGDVHAGTATLKTAVSLYRNFRNSSELGLGDRPRIHPMRPQGGGQRTEPGGWPDWGQPTDETLLGLAQALTPLVRFLRPDIVAAIAQDTRRHAAEWSLRFRECGVDPAIYLWDGTPCAFPGVRRHAGSKEISEFRRQSPRDTPPPHCLAIDDNDYPKHLWAFVFTGKPFRKKGPDGYMLGHLIDHKEHGNRWREELRVVGDAREPPLLFGLFTSAANTAYFPSAFLRPTDFSFHLRSLIQRRAQHLYGDVCLVLPPGLELKPGIHPSWEPERFHWNPPVGQTTHLPAFLEFRRRRIDELLRNRADAIHSRSDAQNPDA